MTHYTFTIQIQKRYAWIFRKYMMLFNAKWRCVEPFPAFEHMNWRWGRFSTMAFCFAAPAYYRAYELLICFVGLTRAKILLYDHSDDAYAIDPKPRLLRTSLPRFTALDMIIALRYMYRQQARASRENKPGCAPEAVAGERNRQSKMEELL